MQEPQEPETDPYAPPAPENLPLPPFRRPRRVLVIGILFCVLGVLAAGTMVWAFALRQLTLNPMVLMLPVGIGLLKGRTSSQWWASVWLALGCGLCLLLGTLEWIMPGNLNLRWNGKDYQGAYSSPVVLAVCAVNAMALGTLHWLLRSPKAAFYFREKRLEALRERFHPRRR